MAGKSEEAEGGATEGVDLPQKKVSGKKMAIILVLLLLLIGGGAGAAYFMGMFGAKEEHAEEGEHGEKSEHAEAEEEHGGGEHGEEGASTAPVYFDMPAMVINLASTGRRPSYVRIRVQLLLNKEEERQKVTDNQPRIVDSFQTYLREVTMDELQGSAGLLRLREELLVRVNAAVAPINVKDILFQEILPQ